MGAENVVAGGTFQDIVELYSGRVFNLALKMLGNREDAEEATQDVFMKVHDSMRNFRGDSSLGTWIWRITTNVCLTRRKKKKIASVSLDDIEVDPPDGRIDAHSKQERTFFARQRTDLIDQNISMLPPNESAVITLFYIEELSYEEISDILKMPTGTVSTLLHRGRRRLGQLLRQMKEEL